MNMTKSECNVPLAPPLLLIDEQESDIDESELYIEKLPAVSKSQSVSMSECRVVLEDLTFSSVAPTDTSEKESIHTDARE